MDFLQSVLGHPGRERDDYQDFVDRFTTGDPKEGYTQEEAITRYEEIAPRLPDDEYEESAARAFERLTPDERRQFGEWMRDRAREQGTALPELSGEARFDDARELARTTRRIRREQPNLLQQAFGEGGVLSNPVAKVVAAGIAAMAAQRLMGGRRR